MDEKPRMPRTDKRAIAKRSDRLEGRIRNAKLDERSRQVVLSLVRDKQRPDMGAVPFNRPDAFAMPKKLGCLLRWYHASVKLPRLCLRSAR